MGVCFLCDAKLFGERTRVCSSITPHSNVPYPEKIVDLMGEDFVVIVTPIDHMCKRCTSLLVHMDKLENDLKLVKNAMISYIQKKYGILPADQPIKSLEVVNGHLKTDDLEVGQRKVPSGLTTVRENNAIAHSPIKMIKPAPPVVENSSKMKIYKCGFCAFQSKELGHVRFHMRTHMNNRKAEIEKASPSPAPKTVASTPLPPPQKKRLYRCQVCSKSFDSRVLCLEHIQKDHNHATSTSNEEKESEVTSSDATKVSKPDNKIKSVGKQQVESTKDSDETKEDKDKSVVDTDMLLNDNSQSEEMTIDEPEQTENNDEVAQHVEAEQEATEEAVDTEEHEGTVNAEQAETANQEQETSAPADDNSDQEDVMQVDEETTDSGEKRADTSVENKARDLDIESMLAAIHNDNTDSADTQNSV